MELTPSRQRNAVSEGMALGLLMCGRTEVPFDKVAVDLCFASAFRSWTHSSRFRQVLTDLKNGSDGTWVMIHADKDKHVLNLYWDEDGRTLGILARGYWQENGIDAAAVAESIDGDLAAERWKELAEAFLSRLERD